MRVFLTGATGWLGFAIASDLIAANHQVVGLARDETKAAAIRALGADVVQATLGDGTALRSAAVAADAVIHTAFNHSPQSFAESVEQDRRAIETLGDALAGSDRPLIVTSGLSGLPPGATEAEEPAYTIHRKSESTARGLSARGLRASTIRLAPCVHGVGETHGLVPILIRLARATGVSAYLGDGQNRWSGVHCSDAARLYRLALEQGVTRPVYHAAADPAVPFKAIADVIGRRLGLPVAPSTPEHFGWLSSMVAADLSATSEATGSLLGWTPSGPDLLTDLDQDAYFGFR